MAFTKLRINLLDKGLLKILHMPQFWLQSEKVWLSQRKLSCQIKFHRPLLSCKREIKMNSNHWKNNAIYISCPVFGAWRLCTTPSGSQKSSQNWITPVKLSYASYESTKEVPKHFQPVVILHGLLGSKMNWKTLAKVMSLKSGRKVFTLDARNHGDSPHTEEIDYHNMAADIEVFMDDMGLCKVVLIGHSMGGKTAMTLALKKDFWVRQFILTNVIESEKEITWRVNLDALERKLSTDLLTFPEFSDCYNGDTLFICGEKSNYVRKGDHEEIHKLFPKAKILYIKEAGHWVHSERPEQFLDAVLEFLNIKDQEKC
ncbi:protein ABHD11-like [Limulus polyphemus]|uniref:sn-1-specific diacylglycerol lipase ABHD11 n=1 Tax=Limulus polyphemus TaxID=6850 RepID=A0ABM1BSF8_LIMPO|nr:protein ABHD11-like [Limulus polyphemus]